MLMFGSHSAVSHIYDWSVAGLFHVYERLMLSERVSLLVSGKVNGYVENK